MSFWKNLGRRLAAPAEELEADDLVVRCSGFAPVAIADVGERELVEVAGVVRAMTFPPRQRVPELSAELSDGSGSVVLVWLGRREIRGIHPGAMLRVRGRVCLRRGRTTIFNPAYELLPPSADSEHDVPTSAPAARPARVGPSPEGP